MELTQQASIAASEAAAQAAATAASPLAGPSAADAAAKAASMAVSAAAAASEANAVLREVTQATTLNDAVRLVIRAHAAAWDPAIRWFLPQTTGGSSNSHALVADADMGGGLLSTSRDRVRADLPSALQPPTVR
jgi:hypothetical protein